MSMELDSLIDLPTLREENRVLKLKADDQASELFVLKESMQEKIDQHVCNLRAENEKLRRNLDDTRRELYFERVNHDEELRQAKELEGDLQKQKEDLQKQKEDLQKQKEDLQKQTEELQKQTEELEKQKEKIIRLSKSEVDVAAKKVLQNQDDDDSDSDEYESETDEEDEANKINLKKKIFMVAVDRKQIVPKLSQLYFETNEGAQKYKQSVLDAEKIFRQPEDWNGLCAVDIKEIDLQ